MVSINYKGLGKFLAGGTFVFSFETYEHELFLPFFYYSPYLKINALIVKFLLNSNHNFRNSRVLPFEAHGGGLNNKNMASWGRIHQAIITVSILYFRTADFVELTGIQTENISCHMWNHEEY